MDEDAPGQGIADALQEAANGETEGALLLGFVAVSEWLGLDGGRWLTLESGDGRGSTLPRWQLRGYLNEGLNDWPDPVVEEDEED